MSTFFISDLHLNHTNILKYCSRPFSSTQEMTEKIINNWNSEVKQNDSVYVLGDFGFHSPDESYSLSNILKRLNGNSHLILGNHDKQPCKGWKSINQYLKISIDMQQIVLFHYPIESWEKKRHGVWHLHGHSHGTIKDNPNILRIDVGLDAACLQKFGPISFEEVGELMKKKDYAPFTSLANTKDRDYNDDT
jgi:calcineurin-like phosphoesterase family protein